MIEKVLYIADDGREFEDEKECLTYERDKAYRAVINNNELHMWDADGNPETAETIETISFVKFDTLRACDYFEEVCNEYGIYTPWNNGADHYEKAPNTMYYWDYCNDEWVDFTYELHKVKQRAKIFGYKMAVEEVWGQ